MPRAHKSRRRKGKRGDMPHTVAKRYKVCEGVIRAIEKAAPVHGSNGRALQVATELLIRLPRPIPVPEEFRNAKPLIGKTYKLTPRTVELIDDMVKIYGRRGDVLAACAEILKD